MKILYVIETLNRGGAELFLMSLSEYIISCGHDVEIVYLFGKGELVNLFNKKGIVTHNLTWNKYNFIYGGYKLSRIIRRKKYDIVHAHLYHASLVVSTSKIFGPKYKTVLSHHNKAYDDYPVNTAMKYLSYMIDRMFIKNMFDVHIAVSSEVMKSVKKHLRINKIIHIPNGVDVDNIEKSISMNNYDVKSELGLENKKIVLVPGRLVWEKGHKIFLSAWDIIYNPGENIAAIIIGDGPLKSSLQQLINNNYKEKYVYLMPSLDQVTLFSIIKSVDLVVIPSVSEGWGMVAAESMALKTAVIASNVGGLRDLLQNDIDICVFKSGNSLELAEKMISIIKNDEMRHDVSIRQYHFIKNNYDIINTVEKHIRLYSHLTQNYG